MSSRTDRVIVWLFQRLARSALLVRGAVFVRRLSTAVIGHRLGRGGIDPERNGELWLLGTVAPMCRQFVDVGANVGEWSTMLLALAPDAHGILFEPSLCAASSLRERFGGYEGVQVVEAAVADAPGHSWFYEEPNAGETSSLLRGHSAVGSVRREVAVVCLDDECDRLGIARVDVLKIDAEGFDLHVLRGARRMLSEGRVGVIQFEYNRPWALAGATLGAALSLLEEAGMRVFVLWDGELRTYDYRMLGEPFWYANLVALDAAMNSNLASFVRGSVLD